VAQAAGNLALSVCDTLRAKKVLTAYQSTTPSRRPCPIT